MLRNFILLKVQIFNYQLWKVVSVKQRAIEYEVNSPLLDSQLDSQTRKSIFINNSSKTIFNTLYQTFKNSFQTEYICTYRQKRLIGQHLKYHFKMNLLGFSVVIFRWLYHWKWEFIFFIIEFKTSNNFTAFPRKVSYTSIFGKHRYEKSCNYRN
jgi:hypothetical protein